MRCGVEKGAVRVVLLIGRVVPTGGHHSLADWWGLEEKGSMEMDTKSKTESTGSGGADNSVSVRVGTCERLPVAYLRVRCSKWCMGRIHA